MSWGLIGRAMVVAPRISKADLGGPQVRWREDQLLRNRCDLVGMLGWSFHDIDMLERAKLQAEELLSEICQLERDLVHIKLLTEQDTTEVSEY